MTSIRRSHPQPDSPRENLGPRERSMAVFKYLLDIDPEHSAGVPWTRVAKERAMAELAALLPTAHDQADAVRSRMSALEKAQWRIPPHPLFSLIEHAFSQANRVAVRAFIETLRDDLGTEFHEIIDEGKIPQLDESLVQEINTIHEVQMQRPPQDPPGTLDIRNL